MSKHVTVAVAIVVVTTIAVIATIAAQPEGDPSELSCIDEFVAVATLEPSSASYHATPMKAAAATVPNMQADGKLIPADAELIDVTDSHPAVAGSLVHGEKVIAARVGGNTLALLGMERGAGETGWAVGSYVAC